MTSANSTTERPILPPTTETPRAAIADLQALVSHDPQHLILSNGHEQASLPEQIIDALRQTLVALARNQAVTILTTDTLLTTQQAAEVLGVSRPTLIKILETGDIPYLTPGRHRRIQLTDVLAYQRRRSVQAGRALDELMEDSGEFYLNSPSNGRDL